MSSMLFRAIVTPFHLLLDWPKSSFIFFCKMLWKNPNGLFGQPSIHKESINTTCLILKLLPLNLTSIPEASRSSAVPQ